jgi:hypothetical protein
MSKGKRKNRRPQPHLQTAPAPSPELERILCELQSPDEGTRAAAVRELCPCRGTEWGVPVFHAVLALREDPSPVVRHAVQHDLSENPDWGEQQERRRLDGRRALRESQRVRAEIEAGPGDGPPPPHSLGWRMPRRPRSRKGYYPRGKG